MEASTIVAVWGIESDYGKTVGLRHVVRSLATLACTAPRRRDYFRSELIAALRVAATNEIPYEALYGSWAGAFGGPQLMPTVFFRVAVDGDGDGKRDVARSVPDVLASIANFVHLNGWRAGLAWGVEVELPDSVTEGQTGRLNRKPVSSWAAAGVRRVDGRALLAAACRPTRRRRSSCRRDGAARPSWSPAISRRSTSTIPPSCTRCRSATSPTGCAAAAPSPRPGRPASARSTAPAAASCRAS